MRIGVFHNKPYYLRHYETTLRALLERGHQLMLARPDRFESVKVPGSLRLADRVSTGLYPYARNDGLAESVEIIRTARDAVRYLLPELRAAEASRRRAFEQLVRVLAANDESQRELADLPWRDLLGSDPAAITTMLADLERFVPPDEELVRFIREQELDVVFCISRINVAGRQTEVVKAAAALGVPAGVAVYSWDNLTNKGTLHAHPDRLFVWNAVQVREAIELHGVDPVRVVATGAPRFDSVFAGASSATRADLLGEFGLDRDRATILYLGSSAFVAPEEPAFVDEWLAAVRASDDARVREANVIVRPHPGAAAKPSWIVWRPRAERVALPPAVVRSRDQDLLDQLAASDAVVGLNTSAEIEAAILGKPVLTVRAGAHAPGQEGQLHFRYLLEEDGGFVRSAGTLEQHVGQLAEALAANPLAGARRRFLETFVRPRGIDADAGPVLAGAIEELGVDRLRERPLAAAKR
jgi:hypothetical protein